MFIKDANHKGAGTYCLISPHGKMYIGKSVEYRKRMGSHRNDAYSKKKNGNWKENKYLYRALRKWGWDRFEKFLFQKHDETRADIDDVLNKQEIALIAEFETFNNRDKGYNLTAGGEGTSGYKMTPEQLAASTAASIKSWADPRRKEEQSKRARQMWEDPEYKQKTRALINDALKRPEVKEKHSASAKELWQDPIYKEKNIAAHRKAVVSKQLISGENRIKEYQLRYHASRKTAAEELGILFCIIFDAGSISRVVSGKFKRHRGFEFENYKGAPGQPTPERPIKRMRVTNI
tara:strand:+ start:582 stop:1454 length:873 start_codon:yes stop_codon:yes gene_type:complete